ncbi:MAG: PLP-dependent transferase [Proteiniphilum sp.]|uniref:PLP-dependent transferase n=1 Tax=Proteiniphilum sp. TaxID=1926877 RepID=UPI002B206367|nr:PLP-dependent transferase [Proteiniphilum sp.]MEA5062089.1 PLP-dependent transferase [Petrimonas sp.]MEA5128995.1 PLP-dependent transferase [Proteiniphilum sp.]
MNEKEYEAKLLSTPCPKPDPYGALSMPVYRALAYEFETAEEMEAAFCGRTDEHTYSRITNPTVQHFEQRVKRVTGAYGVTALNSGMAAISNTLITLAWSGCNLITSRHLFGNTYSFFANTLNAFGMEARFCDLTNAKEVAQAIDEHTCGVFLEIITNPQMEVADLAALSEIAHERGVPLIADTTIIPFSVFHAIDFGVDIEVVASTKYISGGATSLGGLIIDYGRFNQYRTPALRALEGTSQSPFHTRLRKEVHRNLGAYMTPDVAYQQSLGLETLQLRFERQAAVCKELAGKLKALPAIKTVSYTGLEDNPFYEISKKQFGDYPGAMLTFDLESREECYRFINKLKLIRRATNLFDNRSLIIHPASTIFGSFTDAQREAMNVKQTTIRLSVGLESVDSLFDDICQALV